MQTSATHDTRQEPSAAADGPDATLYRKLGEVVRSLHEALSELGLGEHLQQAVGSLPGARSGLSYISRLTGEAAEKVLNAVDRAKADQDALRASATALGVAAGAERCGCAPGVVEFAEQVRQSCERTDAHLTDIMMAQDFHDLTGQVTRGLIDTVQRVERDLLLLLVEAAPAHQRPAEPGALSGPVTDAAGRTDVVENQKQVDDLLDSLGF